MTSQTKSGFDFSWAPMRNARLGQAAPNLNPYPAVAMPRLLSEDGPVQYIDF